MALRKHCLQPLNGVAPLWGVGLAHGVLISEQPDLVEGFHPRDRIKPLDSHETLGSF